MDTELEPPMSTFAHPLAYVRSVRGWSAADLLDLLAEHAGAQLDGRLGATDRNKVHRWEKRGVVPELPLQHALAHLLDVPVDRIARHPWPRWLPAFGGLRPLDGWSPGSALGALDDVLVADAADPRAYLCITGAPLRALGTGWLDARPTHVTAVARGPLRVEEETIGRIERHADVLRTLDQRLAGPTVAAAVYAQLRLVAALLAEGSFTARVARRLFLAVADLAHLAGWAAVDAGRHFAAQRYHRAALYAAHAAGGRTLGGYLLICLAYQAIHHGEPGDALRLAESAVHGVRGAPSARARGLLGGHLAVIRAATGRLPAGGVPEPQDLLPGPHDPPWARWFDIPTFTARRYLLVDDGDRPLTEPVVGRLAAAEPAPPLGRHRRLHQLAERLATGTASLRAIRDSLDELLPPAA